MSLRESIQVWFIILIKAVFFNLWQKKQNSNLYTTLIFLHFQLHLVFFQYLSKTSFYNVACPVAHLFYLDSFHCQAYVFIDYNMLDTPRL